MSIHDEELRDALAEWRAGSSEPISLRAWTVEDFSKVYTLHRSHLVSYARNFLPNVWEAEEVVQDAFLYLMTAMPELDSELGILRFLKWKTKMLALDVLRLKSRSSEIATEFLPEFADDQPGPSEMLERADDASIVNLALARLSDKQREALVATQIEGKSSEEVAASLGMSSNAFRQLLFRARASFKTALVGEAEVNGLSTAEIFSVAAKKVARDAGRAAGVVGSLLILTLVSIGMFGQSQAPTQQPLLASDSAVSPSVQPAPLSDEPESPRGDSEDSTGETETLTATQGDSAVIATVAAADSFDPAASETLVDSEFEDPTAVLLSNELDEIVTRLALTEPQSSANSDEVGLVRLALGQEITASVGYDLSIENPIQHVVFTFETGKGQIVGVPRSSLIVREVNGDVTILHYAATDLVFGDLDGTYDYAASGSRLDSLAGFSIKLIFGSDGNLLEALLAALPRA